ncbi:MAG: winged helix-turn-helix transcriptional regulator [Isosphaeraceae bacterium]
MSDPPAGPPSRAGFPTTRWSRVVAAGDPRDSEARQALEGLCRDYWYPLYVFIRRKGFQPDEAADLTQAYFARLLEAGVLAAADRRKGRFRAFLRTDCGFFLSHQVERDRAAKRCGGAASLSIDARDAEGRYLREPADPGLSPDRLFDRAWALRLLDGVLRRLAVEYAETGRAAQFDALQVVLSAGPRSVPYAEIAARLGISVGAVQAAVQRLRRRYRDVLREQVAATLENPDDTAVEEELRDLFAALGG